MNTFHQKLEPLEKQIQKEILKVEVLHADETGMREAEYLGTRVRFRLQKTAILRFIRDDRIPFDNSLAERDIQMMKVKQEISGSFRTVEGSSNLHGSRLRFHSPKTEP